MTSKLTLALGIIAIVISIVGFLVSLDTNRRSEQEVPSTIYRMPAF